MSNLTQIPQKSKQPKLFHVDGGAFVEPPSYKFHDAYFSVLDSKGKLIHFEKNLGDMWSGLAEFMAIKWVIENIKKRPLTITSDCTTAIAWARKGGNKKTKKITVPPINISLEGVTIEYQHSNLADIWNALNHSPKHPKSYYIDRWRESLTTDKTFEKRNLKTNIKINYSLKQNQ